MYWICIYPVCTAGGLPGVPQWLEMVTLWALVGEFTLRTFTDGVLYYI